MRRHLMGVLVTLTLSLCCAALPATASPVGRISRIGVLMPTSAAIASPALQAFQQALRARSDREGHTLVLEERFAQGRYERLPSLAAELVRLPVDVLVAGSPSMIRAATQATTAIPIVGIGVPTGLFASFTRPANLTGIASGGEEVRKIGRALLEEVVPGLSRAAVLWDPHSGALRRRGLELGARLAGLRLQALEVRGPDELEWALAEAARGGAEALIVPGSGLFAMHQRRIAELALTHRLPTLAPFREFAEAGCLMAYGPNLADLFRRAATFVDQILQGAKPADLSVEPPARFELVINRQTATALGLTLPPSLLSRADEVLP
jgi:putative tryptophan/tyrosine transport system substrate-binding protein